MSETIRTRGTALFLLALAAAAAVGAVYLQSQARPVAPDPAALIGPLKTRAESAVRALPTPLEPVASQAAHVPELVAAFETGVDAATFQDALESEDWWKPFRDDGRVSAVITGKQILASLFAERLGPALDPVAQQVGGTRVTSGFAALGGRLYAVAAARIDRSKRAAEERAVVVLGRPVDEPSLAAVARSVGAQLGVSDGSRLMVTSDPADAAGAAALLGREAQGPGWSADGRPVVATPLARGLWLLVVGVAPAAVAPSTPPLSYGLFGAALLLMATGMVAVLRRPHHGVVGAQGHSAARPAPTAAPAPPRSVTGTGAVPESDLESDLEPASRPTELLASGGSGSGSAVGIEVKPHVFGRYALHEKIGEGGMAEVYRATMFGAEGFERQLVVKRLHPNLASNKEAISQFIDEARLQATLVHSNIVPVFDFGRAGQDYFLALEYIEGRDLEKLLERHMQVLGRPLDLPVVAYVVHEILAALQYAHTRTDNQGQPMEIVHRDVSLANILLSYAGEVKLSDFGIVKAERRVSKTQVGMVKGNAGFMAPEQARGEPVDARADVFSTGVVTYCCLTGQPLYGGEGLINQLLRAAVGPGTQQFDAIDRMHPDVAHLIVKALAASPAERFASAGEFARALRPFVGATRDDVAKLMRDLFTAEKMKRDVG